jgi:prophage DNA circulation protein
MAWKDDLQDASFRGVPFECISTKDAVSRSQAIHQAPYSDEALIEDMGKDPRKISIQAVFTGEDYKAESDNLIIALDETGSGELIHPIYGICTASVLSHNVDHDAENVDTCYISIEFILGKDQQKTFFVPVATVDSIDTTTIIDAPATALETALEQLNNADKNQFFTVVNNIRNGINTARSYLNLAKATIEDILSPADYIVGLVDDLSQLVTFDTSISAISKWRDLAKRISRFGNLFTDDDTPTSLKQLWTATQVASTVAVTQQIIESIQADMVAGNEVSLTPIDLAVIRQQNRQVIQAAINTEREQTADALQLTSVTQIQIYKDVADQLHLQIQELIETRPPITTTTILVPCSLHWLAHQLYEDYTRADEIRRLNPNLQNPAVLLKGMELTVYAR